MSYEGDNRRKWRVTRDISVSDLVVLASACAAVFLAYAKLDVRISLMEQFASTQAIEMERTNRRVADELAETNKRVTEEFANINRKLDRLIETRSK